MSITVKVIKNDFAHLALELQARISTAKDITAEGVKNDAEQRSPDQLGISKKWRVNRTSNWSSTIRNSEWRAVFYEHGTPFLPQVAMLDPAVEAQAPLFEERLKLAFEK